MDVNAAPAQDKAARMAPPPELDAFTLYRAKAGDARACRQLVERYQRPVFALLSRMLGHGTRVEDLAQETFLRVFGALPGFDPGGPAKVSTWILTIASRLALDELRRRPPAMTSLEDADAVPSSLQTDTATHNRQRAAMVQRALDSLGVDHRATFVLWAFHDLSYQDMATVLGVEEGTVKSRLHRARTTLQQLLGDEARP